MCACVYARVIVIECEFMKEPVIMRARSRALCRRAECARVLTCAIMCVCTCVCVCVRACMRSLCVCMQVCMYVCACVCTSTIMSECACACVRATVTYSKKCHKVVCTRFECTKLMNKS